MNENEITSFAKANLEIEPSSASVNFDFQRNRKHLTLFYHIGSDESRATMTEISETLAKIPVDLARASLIVRNIELTLGAPSTDGFGLQTGNSSYSAFVKVEVKPLVEQIARDAQWREFWKNFKS